MFAPVLYYLFVYPISRLPFRALYAVSDLLYCLVYYVIPYRKKIVFRNLRNSFPEKSEQEITAIAKKFYHHFCDITLESLKMFSISKQELSDRFTYRDKKVMDKLFLEGKNAIGAGGHYNNWEFLAVAGKLFVQQECSAIYKPLQNKWFDRVMRASRTQLGLQMWPISQAKEMFDFPRSSSAAYFFALDQSPSNPRRCHWMTFLNQETGVSYGAEKYAKEYNLPVVYYRIHKEKRGYYSVDFELVIDEPNQYGQGQIVEKLMKILEVDIKNKPEYWLWTHNRWKRKRPGDTPLSNG